MKSLVYLLALGLFVVSSVAVQAKKEEEAESAEQAYAALEKIFSDKDAEPNRRVFEKLSQGSIAFICERPHDGLTFKLIGRLVNYGVSTIKGRSAELKLEWFQRVQADVAAKQLEEALSVEAKTALLAVEAAMLEGSFKTRRSNEVFRNWRERLDELAKCENSDRFVRDREQGFVEALYPLKPEATEARVRKLAETGGRYTAEWARGELQLIEVRKKPFEMSFKALDGKDVDFSKLRGKYVFLVFWSADAKGLMEQRNALAESERDVGAKNFAVLTVLCDREIDAAKAAEIVAQKKMKWPVLFDGAGEGGVYARQLNVSAKNLPAGFLFDQQGLLIKTNVQMKNAASEVRKLLDAEQAGK